MEMTRIKWDETMITRCFSTCKFDKKQEKEIQNVLPAIDIGNSIDEISNDQYQEMIIESEASDLSDKKVFRAFMNDNAQKLNNEQNNVKTDVKADALSWDEFFQAMANSIGKSDENFDD